eukprot:6210254-Pleurochrysis_carterae.AAC.1
MRSALRCHAAQDRSAPQQAVQKPLFQNAEARIDDCEPHLKREHTIAVRALRCGAGGDVLLKRLQLRLLLRERRAAERRVRSAKQNGPKG